MRSSGRESLQTYSGLGAHEAQVVHCMLVTEGTMFRRWLSALIVVLVTSQAAADRLDRIEPASWWIGMKDDRLQLLVHGDRIAELVPSIHYPGVSLTSVERVENPDYLFVNLRISPDASPGSLRIEFSRRSTVIASWELPLQARDPGSADRAGFGPADVIYLITPDRFANGDPSNDNVQGMHDGHDRDNRLGRHGGDLAGVAEHLDYVAGMGFTQIWLNPVLENNQPDSSYHGYAITDFYRVDPRYGTNEDYRELSRSARARGVGMIMDAVLNHCGSGHWWMKDPPAADWFNHGGKFAGTSHAHETVQDPYGTEEDRRAFTDGWFVPTMPDLNQRNPHLATYLIQNSIWWIEYANLSGLRVDTYPYSDRQFMSDWSRRVMEEYPRLNIVGEEWNGNPITVSYWQRGKVHADGYVSYLPSLFDFPLTEAVIQGLREEESSSTGLVRIYRSLAGDSVYPDPYNLVVFPDNHDTLRVYTQLDERAGLDRMAVAFFLTTRGIPQIYYGTEILMGSPEPKDDGLIRSDFPGGWPDDRTNAFTGSGLTPDQLDMQRFMRALQQWRRGASALHHGKLTQYVPRDGVYVYFRHDDTQKVMVILNHNDAGRTVDTRRFHEVIGGSTRATDVLTGAEYPLSHDLPAPAYGAVILELR